MRLSCQKIVACGKKNPDWSKQTSDLTRVRRGSKKYGQVLYDIEGMDVRTDVTVNCIKTATGGFLKGKVVGKVGKMHVVQKGYQSGVWVPVATTSDTSLPAR